MGATVASVWGDIFHHPDDEAVLDNTLACVRWMYSEWDGVSRRYGLRATWDSRRGMNKGVENKRY